MNTKTKQRILLVGFILALCIAAVRTVDLRLYRPAKAKEIESVQKYLVVTAPFLEGRELTAKDIEARCDVRDTSEGWTSYTLLGSDISVAEAESITELTQMDAYMHLRYVSKDGKEVKLVYSDQGLYGYVVFDLMEDWVIFKEGDQNAIMIRILRIKGAF